MALMLQPQVGDTLILARSFGVDPGSLPEGASLEVVDIVEAGTPGIGGDGLDRLVLKYVFPSTVVDDAGTPSEGEASRLLSLTVEELNTLVEADNG